MKPYIHIARIIPFLFIFEARGVVHFTSDFESATDNGTLIVDGNNQLVQGFGDVSLGYNASHGSTAAILNLDSQQSIESFELNLAKGLSDYRIEFDISSSNLFGSRHGFSLQLSPPSAHPAQALNFGNCCNNGVHMFSGQTTVLGTLEDDKVFRVVVDVDFNARTWAVDFGSLGADSVSFSNNEADLTALRFVLSPAHGAQSPDPNVSVFIDNLSVTSIPEPSITALLGLCACVFTRRRR